MEAKELICMSMLSHCAVLGVKKEMGVDSLESCVCCALVGGRRSGQETFPATPSDRRALASVRRSTQSATYLCAYHHDSFVKVNIILY